MKNKIEIFKKRPLSWSSIQQFNYDKEAWYRKYIEGKTENATPAMEFGKKIGEMIAKDPLFLPKLPRYEVFEQKLTASIGEINLVGYLDGFCPKTKSFHEYKTSSNDNKWNQESVNKHGQLKMYKFLIWKNYGVAPEEIKCHLHYIPVITNNDFSMDVKPDAEIQTFESKHTALDILNFAIEVENTFKDMIEFCTLYPQV